MEQFICKTCGAAMTRSGNTCVCSYCGNKWTIDVADDVHAVQRVNAWEALRNGDFERATELFDEILIKNKNDHEACWGKALALNAILYVTDINESKKIPTCNNITKNSFAGSTEVKRAIELAPSDIADSYKKQAEYIDKVRTEWLERASREPSYDVFISYKDSDRENGIERTQDSVDAQDLYNALVAEGYKVFFSRISLRDKISEQYEPYIYNAINTAKVMIVFGEKPEYFSSVWIKNEWQRFRSRIESGEKHKNSLVVAYKNMSPSDLPRALSSRQCLNAADMTFLPDLYRHIKRVIEETKPKEGLERITIEGGEISKKASEIQNESIKKRELGEGHIAETSVSEKQQLSLVDTYMNGAQWERAAELIEDILFNNPNCAEALEKKLFLKHKAKDFEELAAKILEINRDDIDIIKKILNSASQEFGEAFLASLYQTCESGTMSLQLLSSILEYEFGKRDAHLKKLFENAIENGDYPAFSILLKSLDNDEVDRYIALNLSFAKANRASSEAREKCVSAVLSVESGNLEALWLRTKMILTDARPADELQASFEQILHYSHNINSDVLHMLDFLRSVMKTKAHAEFAKFVIRCYQGEHSEIKEKIKALAEKMIACGFFDDAEHLIHIITEFYKDEPSIYWDLCLIKTRSISKHDTSSSDVALNSLPEFTKFLALSSEDIRTEYIRIADAQEADIYWRICINKLGVKCEEDIVKSDILLNSIPEFAKLLKLATAQKRSSYLTIASDQEALIKERNDKKLAEESRKKSSQNFLKFSLFFIVPWVAFIALLICAPMFVYKWLHFGVVIALLIILPLIPAAVICIKKLKSGGAWFGAVICVILYSYFVFMIVVVGSIGYHDEVELNDAQDFQIIVNHPNARNLDYILLNDIDFENTSPAFFGKVNFGGTFNGNGYCIKNINIKKEIDDDNFGMFSSVSGVVKNLTIKDSTIYASRYAKKYHMVSEDYYMGAITPELSGTIDHCYVIDVQLTWAVYEVNPYYSDVYLGGIAGSVTSRGKIINSQFYSTDAEALTIVAPDVESSGLHKNSIVP